MHLSFRCVFYAFCFNLSLFGIFATFAIFGGRVMAVG